MSSAEQDVEPRGAFPAAVAAATLALVAWLGGLFFRWGDISAGTEGPPGDFGFFGAVALLCLIAAVVTARSPRRERVPGLAIVAGVLALLVAALQLFEHWHQIDAGLGSLFSLASMAFALLAVGLLVVARGAPRRWTAGTSLAGVVVLVAAVVVAGVWWPGHGRRHTTSSAPTVTATTPPTRVLWSGERQPSGTYYDNGYLTATDDRLIEGFLDGPLHARGAGCRTGVRGIDAHTGDVAWEYSRPAYCAADAPDVSGTTELVAVRFRDTDETIYLDPRTGRERDPAGADVGLVTNALSADRGLVVPDEFGSTSASEVRLTLVDMSDGSTIWALPAPHCTGEQELVISDPYSADQDFGPILAGTDTVAVPYACAPPEDADGAVQAFVWFGRRDGVQTVPTGDRGANFGLGPDLLLVGSRVLACQTIAGSGADPVRYFAIDPASGAIAWRTDLPDGSCPNYDGLYAVVDAHRAATRDGVVDVDTGRFLAPYPGDARLNASVTAVIGPAAYTASLIDNGVTLLRTDLLTGRQTSTRLAVDTPSDGNGLRATMRVVAGVVLASFDEFTIAFG